MSELSEFVVSGPLMLAALLALAAGAVSFASPCCIPLVPGYLGYLAGLVGADTRSASGDDEPPTRASRWRLAGAALLFVAGFTVVFMAAVIVVLGLSDALLSNETVLQRLGGVVMIAMGLVFLGLVPALQRDIRIHRVPRGGIAAGLALVTGLWGLFINWLQGPIAGFTTPI